jgi:hypothetical protein
LRDANAKRFFQEYGDAKHGRCQHHVRRRAALTADAADAIVDHSDEAGLRRLDYKTAPNCLSFETRPHGSR